MKENSTPDTLLQYPNSGEVVVGSSPPPSVSGIVGRALAKDNCAAGWMVLSGWDLDVMTAEEVEEAEAWELETVMACQDSLCSMGSGAKECRGEVMSVTKSVTWDRLVAEALRCSSYQGLVSAVLSGEDVWPLEVRHLQWFRSGMSVMEGVIIYQGRSVIPLALRAEVLATLHPGHQGVTNMWGRAATSVWWPGLYEDISRIRSQCWRCDTNAHSQPKKPPVPLLRVDYPFQQICSDYFSLEGKQYLVMVDWYSGWPSVYRAREANDKELVRLLRHSGSPKN